MKSFISRHSESVEQALKKNKMKKMILSVIITLCLQKVLVVSSCREIKILSSTIGGKVTLSVDEDEFLFIYWFIKSMVFAKTSLDEPVEIRQTEYEERLKSTSDGSLMIMNLIKEDQGQYTANVLKGPSGNCHQEFDLRVFDALSVETCAGQTNISFEEGAEATLPVNQTGLDSITWVTVRDLVHFAITKPGNPVVIQDVRYTDRLNVTANGSLIITGLTIQDQGTYGTYVVTPTSQRCAQLYNLKVTVTNALSVETCAGQTNISFEEGAEATLPVNQTGLDSISWVTVRDLVHFAITKPGNPVVIQDVRYTDRLNVTANGSLIITGLTIQDQGTYGTYVVTPTSQRCAQLYNLRVTVTKSDENQTHVPLPDYTTSNTIRLAISGCLLLITCCILAYHMKTEVMSPFTQHNEDVPRVN